MAAQPTKPAQAAGAVQHVDEVATSLRVALGERPRGGALQADLQLDGRHERYLVSFVYVTVDLDDQGDSPGAQT